MLCRYLAFHPTGGLVLHPPLPSIRYCIIEIYILVYDEIYDTHVYAKTKLKQCFGIIFMDK